jgi:rhodanese-related sulfurtransferase
MHMKKLLTALAVGVVLLSGCSSTHADLSVANKDIDVVIDVRTQAEYATGHIENSLNLDVESGALEASLATLDKQSTYLIYCRSGRRSAIAADLMRSQGFEVLDAGSLENMVNLGWPLSQ